MSFWSDSSDHLYEVFHGYWEHLSQHSPLHFRVGFSSNQNKTITFQNLAKQCFTPRRSYVLFFLNNSPNVWSMKSDHANKGEPGPELVVADKVGMDLSPCELHSYQASVVLTVSSRTWDEVLGHWSPSPADRLLSSSHDSLTGPRA